MIYLWSVWYQIVVYIGSFPALSGSLSLSLYLNVSYVFPLSFYRNNMILMISWYLYTLDLSGKEHAWQSCCPRHKTNPL